MKLKLNTSVSNSAGAASPAPASGTQTPRISLTFKQPGAPASATASTADNSFADPAAPKQKRKYTKKPKDPLSAPASAKTKKRQHDDEEDELAPPKKRKSINGAAIGPPSESGPGTLSRTPSMISLKLKPQRTQTQPKLLVIKAKGQKPERPRGVGYDSEAEDAEDDPAIESQLILRMTPGEDCDLLRKAIEEKTIGDEFPVSFRFWDREGKRISVKIKDHIYAAVLVDLPCIIEGTKSWDKKGWYKSADISQMMLVLGRAKDDKEVQNYPLPPEIQRVYDNETGLYQYPHGLTPPMHYVRKRRFRKRVSYRTIEAVEEEVERLIAEDEKARSNGGNSQYETVDPDMELVDNDFGNDEDAEGDADGDTGLFDEQDDDDMEQFMMDQLGGDDEDEPVTAVSANEAALHALGDSASVVPTTEGLLVESPAGETPGGTDNTEEDDDDDDDDDDDADPDADEEVDEDALAAQQEKAQLREEIADLEKEVEIANQQHDQQKNPLLRKRMAQKLLSLRQDLDTKKATLGEEDEE